MTDRMVDARQLHKSFGRTCAVDGVSFAIKKGEIYGLVGPDGAGKTTTIRLLCGAMKPDSGEVFVGDVSMTSQPDQARQHIGYLSQRFSLYEDMTVMENLRFFAETRGLSAQEWRPRSLEILAFVGLEEFLDRRAGHLSGGMKQKLGLATALVHNPDILLLDEPTGGVDPVTRQDFWQLIIRLVAEQGLSALVSTPYMDEALRCTKVGFLVAGRLVVEDHPQALQDQLNGRVLSLRGSPLAQLRVLAEETPGVEDVQAFGDKLHLRAAPGASAAVLQHLQETLSEADVIVEELAVRQPTLEDVFINLLQEHEGGQRDG